MLLLQLLQNPILLVIFLIGITVSITIHEYAHALAAYKSGDPTPKYDKRLTLNPIAHIDPMGLLFLFLAGFGWGKPVMTNPRNYRHRNAGIYVALAGIAANLVLATLLFLPTRLNIISDSSVLGTILNIIAEINIALAAFNLLPVPPLDGSHVVEHFLDEETNAKFANYGPYILIGLLLLDRSVFPIISVVMDPIVRFFSLIARGTWTGIF